jgi:valyl-tRNA synthetase
LMDQYGTDGVRVGMLLSSPAGNDLMFDESYCEQGRNFANKIWNAFRLMKGWESTTSAANEAQKMAIDWFEARFNEALAEIEDHFDHYRISDALMATYKLVWDDFCAWYLELVKPGYQQPISEAVLEQTKTFFSRILTLIHPFMPFISEELWHDEVFGNREALDCCIVAAYPRAQAFDNQILDQFNQFKGVVSEIRNVRNAKQISPKEALALQVMEGSTFALNRFEEALEKLAHLNKIDIVTEKSTGSVSFLVGKTEFYIPLAGAVDPALEREKIQKEIVYLEGFLRSVEGKLSNDRFVQNAKPEIVENERNKKADAEAKIALLKANLASLNA